MTNVIVYCATRQDKSKIKVKPKYSTVLVVFDMKNVISNNTLLACHCTPC